MSSKGQSGNYTALVSSDETSDLHEPLHPRNRLICTLVIMLTLTVCFLLLVVSTSKQTLSHPTPQPPLILISLDGFRHDFLTLALTPHLYAIKQRGVSPQHLKPVFPSVTFPNHYSIATGLYPESHGIVSNEFFDVATRKKFHYQNGSVTCESLWWGGEPIWVTVEKNGLRSAVCILLLVQLIAKGTRPTFIHNFDQAVTSNEKSDLILEWLDLPLASRPHFIAAYYQQVDMAGHRYGPDSDELAEALKVVDDAIGRVIDGLKGRGILETVNLMIVSDHGMLGVDRRNTIDYSEFIDLSLVELIDHRPLLSVYVLNKSDVDMIYQRIKRASLKSMLFEVYLLNDLDELHLMNRRIGDIFAIPAKGYWFIDKQPVGWGFLPGLHGYDPATVQEMNGVFVAAGPAVKRANEIGVIESFGNVELYQLMCDIIGISAAPNNGTQSGRLMLKDWFNINTTKE